MNNSQVRYDMPELSLSLELDASLARVVNVGDALHQEISEGLAQVMDTLGIPGRPAVEIAFLKEGGSPWGPVLRVSVNGRPCRHSDRLLLRLYGYARDIHLTPETQPGQVLDWLNRLSADSTDPIAFLTLVCLETVKQQPTLLLGPAQVAAYRAFLLESADEPDLQSGGWLPEQAWLLPVLSKVLALKISLADRQVVADTLREGLANERSPDDIVEDLIAAMRPDIVEIHVSRDMLKEMTMADVNTDHRQFAEMRDGLFYELGLHLPAFRFVLTENLMPHSFIFKINHLSMPPRLGLRPDQCLVNAVPDQLSFRCRSTIHPVHANECALTDIGLRPEAEIVGLTTWGPLEYLVLCLGDDLRANGPCFVHRKAAQRLLEQLKQAFPAVVKAVQAEASIEHVTRLLRARIAEGGSILNLRSVFEEMLGFNDMVSCQEPAGDQPPLSAYPIRPGVEGRPAPRTSERMLEMVLEYSYEDIQAFLPLLALSLGSNMPSELTTLLGEFILKIGLMADASPEEALAAIVKYYEEHPVNPALTKEFLRFVRKETAGNFDEFVVKTYTKFA